MRCTRARSSFACWRTGRAGTFSVTDRDRQGWRCMPMLETPSVILRQLRCAALAADHTIGAGGVGSVPDSLRVMRNCGPCCRHRRSTSRCSIGRVGRRGAYQTEHRLGSYWVPPSASCALSTAAQPAELLLPGQPGDPVLAGTHAIKTTVLHLCYRLWLRLMLMPELPAAAAAAATVEHPALPIRAPLLVAPSPRQRMSMDLTAWKRPSTAAGRCSTATWSRACSSASTPGCTATRRSPTTGRCGLAVVGAGPVS